jgi:hypothetical protein
MAFCVPGNCQYAASGAADLDRITFCQEVRLSRNSSPVASAAENRNSRKALEQQPVSTCVILVVVRVEDCS